MSREIFVVRNGKVVPKADACRDAVKLGEAPAVMGDIQPFRTADGMEIGSRSSLRAYEQANGVRQCGNDWTGSSKPAWWNATRLRKQR